MKVIQELVGYFERRGKLTAKQIEKLLKKGFLAAEAPQAPEADEGEADVGEHVGGVRHAEKGPRVGEGVIGRRLVDRAVDSHCYRREREQRGGCMAGDSVHVLILPLDRSNARILHGWHHGVYRIVRSAARQRAR